MIKWFADPIKEKIMNEWNMPWEVREGIQLEQVRVKQGLKNNVRTEALIENNVSSLIEDLANHEDVWWPYTVFYPAGSRKNLEMYDVSDGNHRIHAIEEVEYHKRTDLGWSGFTAYVMLSDDPVLIEQVGRQFNAFVGAGQTHEDRIRHALHALEQLPNARIKDIAIRFRLKESELERQRRVHEVADILHKKSVKTVDMVDTTLHHLHTLRHNEPVLLAAAEICKDYKLSTTQVAGLIKRLRQKRSERTQLNELEEIEKELEHAADQAQSLRPDAVNGRLKVKESLMKRLGLLHQVMVNHASKERCQLTARSDFEQAKFEWEKVQKAAIKIFGKV